MISYEQLPVKSGATTVTVTRDGSIQATVRPKANSFNPFFSIGPDFIDAMERVTNIDLAQSQPVIKVRLVSSQTLKPVEPSLNFSIFNRQIDFNAPASEFQADRPIASIKDLTIDTEEAYGPYYITQVTFNFKIHKPEAIISTPLIYLFIPGQQIEIEYGWSSPNETLNKTERLQLVVTKPNITIQNDGQIDVSLVGAGTTDRLFFQMYLGWTKTDHIKAVEDELKELEAEVAGINREGKKIFPDKFKALLARSREARDVLRRESLAEVQRILQSLSDATSTELKSFVLGGKATKDVKAKAVKLGDIIEILLRPIVEQAFQFRYGTSGETSGLRRDRPKQFKIVIGTFNKAAGKYSDQSLANFEIKLTEVVQLFREAAEKNHVSVTFDQFLSFLKQQLEKPEGYKKDTEDSPTAAFFRTIVLEDQKNNTVEWWIVDARWELPSMQDIFPDTLGGTTPWAEVKQRLRDKGVPYLEFGHANSMIKTATFSPIEQEGLLEHLTYKSFNTLLDERRGEGRDFTATEKDLFSGTGEKVVPMILPLQGSVNVIGHPLWKPFRSLMIRTRTGFFDVIHSVLQITHKLNPQGFMTTLKLIPIEGINKKIVAKP